LFLEKILNSSFIDDVANSYIQLKSIISYVDYGCDVDNTFIYGV
jgi:hypothetical protein